MAARVHFEAAAGGGGGGTPSGVSGSVQFTDGTNFDSDAANFFYDDTQKRLGLGTNTPLGILHLKSTSATTRMLMDGDAGQSKIITYRTAGLQRFGLYTNNTAESGANAGSDFAIRAYADAGTLLSTPLFIKRSTGNIGINTITGTAKLQVVGSGTTSATTSLLVQNSAGTESFKVLDDGAVSIRTSLQLASGITFSTNTNTLAIGTTLGNVTGNVGTLPVYTFAMGSDTSTSSTSNYFSVKKTISPSAGSANFRNLIIDYTINTSGAQTGTATGIFLNATETALNGMGHNLLDLQVGNVSQFKVNNVGAVSIGNTVAVAVGVVSTHKVTVVIGGVTYFLLASV
jgi:hypothetical protein